MVLLGCTLTDNSNDSIFPYDASGLALHWEVVNNVHAGRRASLSYLHFYNNGTDTLPASGWTLYFNFVRSINEGELPDNITISQVNGDLFKLEPTASFEPLLPNDTLSIPITTRYWIIKKAEAPAGFYLAFEADTTAYPPQAIQSYTIEPFVRPEQTRRTRNDLLPTPTPSLRYAKNQLIQKTPQDALPIIIPTPLVYQSGAGTITLDASFEIHYTAELKDEAVLLNDMLDDVLKGRNARKIGAEPDTSVILLRLDPTLMVGVEEGQRQEAYKISISVARGIEITATTPTGIFYGMQTLRSLIPVDAFETPAESAELPILTISDAPRFPYRGLMLDVARNFQPKEAVEKVLDAMGLYKLNRLHLHLTDDQGWRLAIPGLPELTTVGSRRGHSLNEQEFLIPSYGSGPFPDASSGSGAYTRDEFIEILQYARDRHIEIIPEISLPGHARAAIKAMLARSRLLKEQGLMAEADTYLLNDPADLSRYRSVQMWTDNVMDVCRESSYTFIEKVIDEIALMYEEAGAPLTTLHIGGDEVPAGAWVLSPSCLSAQEEDPNLDLRTYFLTRVRHILDQNGLRMGGREELAFAIQANPATQQRTLNEDLLEAKPLVYAWNTVWGWGGEDNAYRLANAGYDVVMASATNLNLELAYSKDPREPGFYWAGFVDTRKVFEFIPLDVYRNANQDVMGHPIDAANMYSAHARLTPEGKKHILGIQGQMWGEVTHNVKRMEYQLLPKMIALAERAWSAQPAWATMPLGADRDAALETDWHRFVNSLGQRELPRLDFMNGGYHYRIPPPGAIVEDGLLRANVAYPGLSLHYSLDGSPPSADTLLYEGPVPVDSTVHVAVFSRSGRVGRVATLAPEQPLSEITAARRE